MRNTNIYTPSQIKKWDVDTQNEKGKWVPARPLPFYGFRILEKLKIIWKVLIGRYDVLDWE